MSFAASFGSNSLEPGQSVNNKAVESAPALILNVPPGFYTVTMTGLDTPSVHWIKSNMFSTGTGGNDIQNYYGPKPSYAKRKRRYILILWHQALGRMANLPEPPTSRVNFSVEAFAEMYGLTPIASVAFRV